MLLAHACSPAGADIKSVSYTEPYVAGMRLKVVSVNMKDRDIRISILLGKDRLGASETFSSLMKRSRPDAAITGTFFGTDTLLPTGDIVIGGRRIWYGPIGTGVAFGKNNAVRFVDTRYGRQTDWSDFETVLCGGPRLVRSGKVWVYPKAEGFRDPALFTPRIRTAVGYTKNGRLLLVTTGKPVYLSSLAKAMKALGARDAVAMDGGSSTGLFYRGSFIARPQRSLTNVLAVWAYPVQKSRVADASAKTSM